MMAGLLENSVDKVGALGKISKIYKISKQNSREFGVSSLLYPLFYITASLCLGEGCLPYRKRIGGGGGVSAKFPYAKLS